MVFANTFDAGAAGTTVTAENSAFSGDAFTAVETTLSYSTEGAAHGAMGSQSTTAAVSAYARVAVSSRTVRARIYFKLDVVPTSDCHLIQFLSGGTRRASVHINGAGKLRLSDAAGTTGVWTATAAITANVWYCVDLVAVSGDTTATGTLKCAYYALDDTLIEQYASTTANVGAALTLDTIYLGKRSTVTYLVFMDSVAWDTTGTDFIGPVALPPTIVSSESPGTCAVDMRGSASGDGSALTYSISPTAGVTEPVEGLFLVDQQSTDVTYTVTVTQSGTPYTTTVLVPALVEGTGGGFPRFRWNGVEWA